MLSWMLLVMVFMSEVKLFSVPKHTSLHWKYKLRTSGDSKNAFLHRGDVLRWQHLQVLSNADNDQLYICWPACKSAGCFHCMPFAFCQMPSLIGCIPNAWAVSVEACCESYVKACPVPKHVGCCADAWSNSMRTWSSRLVHASLSHASPDMHSCIRHMCSSRISHALADMHSCIRYMGSSGLSHAPPDLHACIRFMCSVHTTPW